MKKMQGILFLEDNQVLVWKVFVNRAVIGI